MLWTVRLDQYLDPYLPTSNPVLKLERTQKNLSQFQGQPESW